MSRVCHKIPHEWTPLAKLGWEEEALKPGDTNYYFLRFPQNRLHYSFVPYPLRKLLKTVSDLFTLHLILPILLILLILLILPILPILMIPPLSWNPSLQSEARFWQMASQDWRLAALYIIFLLAGEDGVNGGFGLKILVGVGKAFRRVGSERLMAFTERHGLKYK